MYKGKKKLSKHLSEESMYNVSKIMKWNHNKMHVPDLMKCQENTTNKRVTKVSTV